MAIEFSDSFQKWLAHERLRKINLSNWALPSFEKTSPYLYSFIAGIFVSAWIGFFTAWFLFSFMAKQGVPAPDLSSIEPFRLPKAPLAADYKAIIGRNLFNNEGTTTDATGPGQKNAQEAKKSDLPLAFTGIIYGGAAHRSLVVLESTVTKQTDTFVLGDSVPGEAVIVDITKNRVYLERNGIKEYIELTIPELPKRRMAGNKKDRKSHKKGSPGADAAGALGGTAFREDGFEREGGAISATRQWVERALSADFSKTLQDAKASPNIVGGNEVRGFVLTRIRGDSVYEKMGFADGDIVESINGIELNDAARAIRTLESMRNENNIEVMVKRNGQTIPMKIQVK